MSFRIINGQAYPVGNFNLPKDNLIENKSQSTSFKSILDEKINSKQNYTVSKHASERLRNLDFNEEDMENISEGFKIAEEKGSKNSIFLYKNVALITSIENKTVITAIEKERAKNNVYTNIDSVVIL